MSINLPQLHMYPSIRLVRKGISTSVTNIFPMYVYKHNFGIEYTASYLRKRFAAGHYPLRLE
jgi:hypothetical protein